LTLSPILPVELSLTIVAEALARVGFHTNVLRADMSQEMGLERSERVGTLDCTAAQL
jgi:hypothetical protein